MGKTRDLFKKIRDTKGTFHAKMGLMKDRNGMEKQKILRTGGKISHQSEWLRSKSLQAINAGEGMEKREPSYTVGGTANYDRHYREQCEDTCGRFILTYGKTNTIL